MIEKIGRVGNPLTIIAIFAALAEVAGTVSLGIVDTQYQGVFVWFVMLFPVSLLVFSFLTLNFNPKVLYAPGDFRDEQNFLTTISGGAPNEMVTVTRESVAEAIKQLPSPSEGAEFLSTDKAIIDAVNAALFPRLWQFLSDELDLGRVKSFSYGIGGEGLFLLQYEIPEEVVAKDRTSRDSIIIQGKLQTNGRVLLHTIGIEGMDSENPDVFAKQLAAVIARSLDECVDQQRLERYRESKEYRQIQKERQKRRPRE